MRSILCPADHSATSDCRIETALALARATNGHVSLQIAAPIAQIAAWEPFGGGVISAAAITEAREADDALAADLEARLASQDVPFNVAVVDDARIEALASESRLADVIVMSIADPALEATALTVRCPVLAVPGSRPFGDFAAPVVAAWDGSAQAANALRAALPLLRLASAVHVVTVREKQSDFPPTDALCYLSRHGIHGELHEVAPSGTISQTIADTARGLDAGMIVMGIYGHSRLRELLLGGVSRDLLARSEVPLLLAH